jgi:hypothetical protein
MYRVAARFVDQGLPGLADRRDKNDPGRMDDLSEPGGSHSPDTKSCQNSDA